MQIKIVVVVVEVVCTVVVILTEISPNPVTGTPCAGSSGSNQVGDQQRHFNSPNVGPDSEIRNHDDHKVLNYRQFGPYRPAGLEHSLTRL